jgi:hypothetical protein
MFKEVSKLMQEHTNFPLFGMLLFTEAHPHIIKALKDADYYSALNEITGKEVALFTTVLFLGGYEYPAAPPGVLSLVVPIWKEPQKNKTVLPWFNIKDSRELPLLVIFGYEGRDFYFQKYPIKAESPQDVFNCLQDVLLRISISVQRAKVKNRVYKQKIFEYAQWEMKKFEAYRKARDFFETVSIFRGAIGV